MAEINKLPPNSIENEQSVIGSILVEESCFAVVNDIIKSEDFYSPSHRIIFDCMKELNAEKKPIDIVTVGNKLREKGYFEDVGGASYLADTSSMVAFTSNVKSYAETVKEKAVLRNLIKASNDIISCAYNEDENINDVLNQAEKKIFEISQDRVSEDFNDINSVLTSVYSQIEEVYSTVFSKENNQDRSI